MKNYKFIYCISFFAGFLSLAQEILWMRLISFAGMSVPQTFSYTLALFLTGISIGAIVGKNICKGKENIEISVIGNVFFVASIVDLLLICFIYYSVDTVNVVVLLGFFVLICSTVRGIAFPMIHHIGTNRVKTGSQISNVYFSNVFGSALAPLFVGFLALDYLNTQKVYIVICFLTMIIAMMCFYNKKLKLLSFICSVFICSFLFLPEKILNQLSKNTYEKNVYPVEILENGSGFIQIYNNNGDQVVYGANVYDGKFNTNIFHNTNGIDRAYLLTAIHPHAKNALVIGLSTGSWVKVLSMMPSLERITVVEINPAYVELIKKNVIVSDLLKNNKIEIIFDDGRKWLKKNQDKKFDIVLMNTTWHWRAYSSNLLSENFLNLTKNVLNKDGVMFYNTTQSLDSYYTAKRVFKNVYKYKFFILASNVEVHLKDNDIVLSLCSLRDPLTREFIFNSPKKCINAKDEIVKNPFITYSDIKFIARKPELITDDNMITEFKYGKGL